MEIWSSVAVSAVILAAALGLVRWHLQSWRAAQAEPLEPEERDYHYRQFRRRMQCSSMLGILAIGILVGRLLMALPIPPLAIVLYWGGAVLLVLWIGLLALVDMLATKHHFMRLRHHCLIEQAKLQAELRRHREKGCNGRGHHLN